MKTVFGSAVVESVDRCRCSVSEYEGEQEITLTKSSRLRHSPLPLAVIYARPLGPDVFLWRFIVAPKGPSAVNRQKPPFLVHVVGTREKESRDDDKKSNFERERAVKHRKFTFRRKTW